MIFVKRKNIRKIIEGLVKEGLINNSTNVDVLVEPIKNESPLKLGIAIHEGIEKSKNLMDNLKTSLSLDTHDKVLNLIPNTSNVPSLGVLDIPKFFSRELNHSGIAPLSENLKYSLQWGEFTTPGPESVFSGLERLVKIHKKIDNAVFRILAVGNDGAKIISGYADSTIHLPDGKIINIRIPTSAFKPSSRGFWMVIGKIVE